MGIDNLNKYTYLFLDRDGVLNIERPDDYVKNSSEFVFVERTLQALSILSLRFEYIFIVTNQRGIGRGVMSLQDLQEVHDYMLSRIEESGGRITRIYFCTDLNPISINRKPNVGMAFQAQRDYPGLDFHKSVMVGNSLSDVEFGNKLGMYTVLVGGKYPAGHKIYKNMNAYYENLYKFAENFLNIKA
jgi:histidinol-phosphate phosphatase family protein